MPVVRLWAVRVQQVHEIFGADETLARRLREVRTPAVVSRPAEVSTKAGGLFGWSGPFLKRTRQEPVLSPDTPTHDDVERLLAGRFVPPDRLLASWRQVETWLDDLADAHDHIDLGRTRVEDLDFALSSAGVEARFGLHHAWERPLEVPLATPPGWRAGLMPSDSARSTAEAWAPALDALPTTLRPMAEAVVRIARAAEDNGTDLVGVYES